MTSAMASPEAIASLPSAAVAAGRAPRGTVIHYDDPFPAQCDLCGRAFESDWGEDEEGHEVEERIIPVKCGHGNFCSEQCRMQACYAAAPEGVQCDLRRLYLAALIPQQVGRAAFDHLEAWEVEGVERDFGDDALNALLPDGGRHGKLGVEDDEDAYLLPDALMAPLESVLFDAKIRCGVALDKAKAATAETTYLSDTFLREIEQRIAGELAAIEAARKALAGLRRFAA